MKILTPNLTCILARSDYKGFYVSEAGAIECILDSLYYYMTII